MISGSGRSPGEGNDYPLQYSCLENSTMLVPYQYNVSITFICAWKPRNSCDLSIGIVAFIGKDPDAGRDWGQKKKGKTEDEMAGWHR